MFQSCLGCHQVGPEAKNSVGPVLNDILGRKAGSYAGYSYSSDLKLAGEKGLIWDEQLLFEWLEGPSGFLKQRLENEEALSKMPFSLADPKIRNDVVTYIRSLN